MPSFFVSWLTCDFWGWKELKLWSLGHIHWEIYKIISRLSPLIKTNSKWAS